MTMTQRILNLLIALDQFIFCILTLGRSNPDETMSSAAWRMERDGKFFGFFRPLIDAIFYIDPQHCKSSYDNEMKRWKP